jgi:signal transduction histidine kinase
VRSPPRALVAAGLLTALLGALLAAWFVSGWADVRGQQRVVRDAPRQAAQRRGAELAHELRSELGAVLAREVERPYFHYQNLFHDPRASAGWSVAPSPLARGPDDALIAGHFQLDAEGGTSTPTINDDLPELSEPARLAEHRRFRDEVRRSLAATLAPVSSGPMVAALEPRRPAPARAAPPHAPPRAPPHVIERGPPPQVAPRAQPGPAVADAASNAGASQVPDGAANAAASQAPSVQQVAQGDRAVSPQGWGPAAVVSAPQAPPQRTPQRAQVLTIDPDAYLQNAVSNRVYIAQQRGTRAEPRATAERVTRSRTGAEGAVGQRDAAEGAVGQRDAAASHGGAEGAVGQRDAAASHGGDEGAVDQRDTAASHGGADGAATQRDDRAANARRAAAAEPGRGEAAATVGGAEVASATARPEAAGVGAEPERSRPPRTLPGRSTPRASRPAAPPPAPILITVSPLEWRTLPFAGQPAIVAVRHIATPDGPLAQGFVIDRAALTARLASQAGDAVAELRTGDDGTTEIVPGWHLEVTANPLAVLAAGIEATAVARGFVLRFVLVGLVAIVAALLVVMLVARAERLARERSQFAAAAAHELRTPLAGLQLYGDMIADDLGDPGKLRDYARRMSEEAARLGRVVSNVLGFSQLERGNLSVEPRPGALGDALRELAERAQPALDRAGATLALDVPPDLAARFDRDALARIIGNLLDNAEKYGRASEDRTITLRARPAGAGVEVTVSDHGPGVAPAGRAGLFQPFRRGVSADGPAGLGLGLALSQSLARAMGGELAYRTGPGGGAAFVLTVATSPCATPDRD